MPAVLTENRGPLIRYVPNEVCIVVEETANELADDEVYKAVLGQLNGWLRRLQPERGKPHDRLEADLTPSPEFYRALQSGALTLRAIERPDGRRQQPWVRLAGRRSFRRLLFYGFGPASVRIDDPALPQHLRRISELVKLANWRLPMISGEGPQRRIVAVTPNWLTGAAFISDSPGTSPEPVRTTDPSLTGPGRYRFGFVDEQLIKQAESDPSVLPRVERQKQLSELVDGLRRSGTRAQSPVAVAVLDTCPTPQAVKDAAARYAGNKLLQEVVAHPQQVVIEAPLSLQASDLAHVGPILPNWREMLPKIRQQGYVSDAADHGLFVAGVVRDIAPQADVYLIRALDNDGTGDLLSLANILRQLPGQYLQRQGYRRLVVNLSLTVDVPPAEQLLREWLPTTAVSPLTLCRRWSDLCALLGRSHLSVAALTDWLIEQQITVVAAAGNNAIGAPTRPAPAVPAAYDEVLGVAAVNRRTRPSRYSNRGDRVVFGNGVAIFGGDGQASGDTLPTIPPPGRDPFRDAVAGLFSAKSLPLAPPGARPNETGWVWWSGTSFSTPIVSAIVADLLLKDTARPTASLLPAVLDFATTDEVTLEASAGPFDCPAIFARQIYTP